MTSPSSAWYVGQVVHRPAAFLLPEKLDGKVQQLRASNPVRNDSNASIAQVAWSDGTLSDEPVADLAAGVVPAQEPSLRWWPLRALFTR